MGSVRSLDHVNVRASGDMIERLRHFYVDIIGLDEGPRPTFASGSRGYWLYAGHCGVVHLTVAHDHDDTPLATGHFCHLAFACADLVASRARLDQAGIAYTTDHVAELGQIQLFFSDPAGIGVELTFVTG